MAPLRFRPAALALAAFVATAPTVATRAAADDCAGPVNGRIASRPDGWTELRPPAFDDGPAARDVTGYAVSPYDADQIFVTNGRSVLRTDNGGCYWDVVYREPPPLPDLLQTELPAYTAVLSVVAPPAQDVAWLLLEDHTTPVARPGVAVSDDGGTVWRRERTGLPAEGRPRLLAAADGRTAYVTVQAVDGRLASQVFRTTDGGASWEPRGVPFLDDEPRGLVVDPQDPATVWVWDDDGLLRSTDGAATFEPARGVSSPLGALAVDHRPGAPALLVGALAGEPALVLSADGGDEWDAVEWPGPATSLAVTGDVLAAVGPAGVAVAAPSVAAKPVPVGPSGADVDSLALATAGGGMPALFARTDRAVLRLRPPPPVTELPEPTRLRRPNLPPVDLDPTAAARLGRPTLAPDGETVDLRPGQHRRVRYRLDLPPVPSPLDVYFLVDTTGSMGSTIAGMRRGIGRIVNDLAAVGIDAEFGLADFQDYPFAPYGGPGDVVYRRNRRIGPADEELRQAISGLALGGGGDGPEAALPALYQSVTGAGQDVTGTGEAGGAVPPNQQAGFRPDAMRVVVLATDAPFHQPATSPGYPGPSQAQTVAALRRHDVKVVGLSIGLDERWTGYGGLVGVARDTGAVAPATGVDCDGDGSTEVAPGAPLVCKLAADTDSVNLAPAIVGMLRSLRDEARVELLVRGGGDVARVAGRPAYDAVNVRERNRLVFDVDYACPDERDGFEAPVVLQGVSRGESLAVAEARVRCLPAPVRRVVPPAAAAVPPVVAPAAPPPPAPQQPPRLEQNLNPQANSQPQAQAHANGAAAAQQQEQPDLALAVADDAPATELAMSRREVQGPTELLLAALALSAAAAVAGSRTSTRQALARARR